MSVIEYICLLIFRDVCACAFPSFSFPFSLFEGPIEEAVTEKGDEDDVNEDDIEKGDEAFNGNTEEDWTEKGDEAFNGNTEEAGAEKIGDVFDNNEEEAETKDAEDNDNEVRGGDEEGGRGGSGARAGLGSDGASQGVACSEWETILFSSLTTYFFPFSAASSSSFFALSVVCAFSFLDFCAASCTESGISGGAPQRNVAFVIVTA